jgi:hypothetical protein
MERAPDAQYAIPACSTPSPDKGQKVRVVRENYASLPTCEGEVRIVMSRKKSSIGGSGHVDTAVSQTASDVMIDVLVKMIPNRHRHSDVVASLRAVQVRSSRAPG